MPDSGRAERLNEVCCLSLSLDLTVDVRDAVGDRLHISEEFKKDGVCIVYLR